MADHSQSRFSEKTFGSVIGGPLNDRPWVSQQQGVLQIY
jgi:hypothetical protein